MRKIVVFILLSLSFLTTCEKKEEPNIEEPNIITGFEGNYISNEFTYPPLGIKTSLILKIGNGLADNDVKSIQMSLVKDHSILVRSIETDSVDYFEFGSIIINSDTMQAFVNIEFDFLDDPECGLIWQLEKNVYVVSPPPRLTCTISAYKDDEYGNTGAMHTWETRLFFYDLIEN